MAIDNPEKIKEHNVLKEMLADRTGTNADDWYLTFRSRDALTVISKELRRRKGECGISLQPLTCSTVPCSVICGGCNPHYSDISIHNLSTDIGILSKKRKSGSPAAVIVQHTYGLIDPIQTAEICKLSGKRDYLLIEDSAHCASRIAKDEDGNPVFDISIHSFGVEKILNTHFGAAVWVNPAISNKALRKSICDALSALPLCDETIDRYTEKYVFNLRVLNHVPNFIKIRLKDRWMRKGYFVPAVSDAELEGGFLLSPSAPGAHVTRHCIEELENIDENESIRSAAVELYSSQLAGNQEFLIPASVMNCNQPLLWFPVLAQDRLRAGIIKTALSEAGVYSNDWGRPLLYPGVTNSEAYQSDDIERTCPVSVFCSDRIVLLPTKVKKEEALRISSVINNLQYPF